MRATRAKAIRRLEAEFRAARVFTPGGEVVDAIYRALEAARAGGPGWRKRAEIPATHIDLDGLDAQTAASALDMAGRRR
jgi:hypothetical protein